MTALRPHDSRTFKCLASSATERKGKSRGDSPTFHKCGRPIKEIEVDDTRRCHEDGHVTAETKKGGRNGTVLHARRFAGSHIL